MCASTRIAQWLGWGVVALLCLDAHAQASWSLGLAPFIQSSKWTEYNLTGARLLTEHGTFHGLALDGAYGHGEWRIRFEGQASKGQRFYDGQDNFGVPVQTHVRVDLAQFLLGVDYRLADQFRIGVDGARRMQRRELMSLPGGPLGYAEHWSTDALALRAGYEWHAHGLWTVTASWALKAKSELVLLLANRDDAVLEPRRQKIAQVALRWDALQGPGWGLALSGQMDWRHADRSDVVPLTRFGALLGSAAQPETTEQLLGVGLLATYKW